ncbi:MULTISPECIES: TIGR02680 family protein [unclassified Streptomyces]|uniref:TIGR02680 family protein n=1 Tax=unclassified Streptomyces TaxID=2593676 RepID=UPI000CD580D4|nr:MULTISPECIES: TIGR02680 family protein [unclassified Streptomyces]AWL41311.1 TIGR02680 family protein [Streptomyces sp. SM18]
MTRLPTPRRSRWQPLRIGLVDLFHYDVEEFRFRDGRLLLRGNNGTGKSKVLALTLPFLLDGDLSPRRVEPDGDPGKRMEWNLLLGGEHPHTERLGYTWIEFGRLDDATGEQHFRTLLCGLKAVSGRGIARHWYAVTRQRVDHGSTERTEESFRLLDATGTALSRDRLAEAVAGHGMVYDQAKAYRRAVDEALFGLGEQRYAALVDLLIQLRQPQLSKRPNEAALSRALTEALPPVDQAVIADVAEAFRSLDEEKDELAAASAAERAASAFLEYYRRYARIATRRRARLPRTEHSRYERVQRDLAEDQERRTRAEEKRAAAEEEISSLAETGERLRAQEAALREAPEMRDARELEHAAQAATRTGQTANRAREDQQQADALYTKALGRLGTADNRLRAARGRAEETCAHVREQAAAAHVALPADDPLPEPESRRAVEEATDRARRALGHIEGRLEVSEQAAAEHRRASGRLDEAETDLALAAETHGEAEENAARAGRALLDDVRERARAWKELSYADATGLLDELQEWTRHLDGPYPARVSATRAHTARSVDLADQAAEAARATTELAERTAEARRELTALEAGAGREPRPPATRTPGLRETLPGAPLWRLVDFRDELPEAGRAGLEAALEASGLLDAWVLPDGSALAVDGHDVLLSPSNGPVRGPSLADVLGPAVEYGDRRAAVLDETTVTRLLAAIGLDGGGGATTWAAPDGRFRVGALTGTWAKPAATYIGEGAREAARRARVAALGIELISLREESENLAARSAAIAARRRTLDAELADVPDESPLTRAHALVSAAAETVRKARTRYEGRAAEGIEAGELAERAAAELTEAAADLGLPAERAGLTAVRHALGSLATALAALWPALREQGEAARQVDDERAEAAEAEQRVVDLAQRAEEAAREAAAADERHRTLRSTVGAAVAELQRRLAETIQAQRICETDRKNAGQRHAQADREASRAEGRIEQLEKDLAEVVDARAEAIAALRRFTATGLIAVALAEVTVPASDDGHWAATPAIAFARAIDSGLSSVDDTDAAWERVQRRLSEELKALQDTLSRHGHSASARMVEDGMVVDIVYQGRERAVPELAEALATEVGELTRILSAHEREILETHLITEVAGTLQELIGAAERQVRDMNTELEDRPTSTGMRLRLVWRASRKAPSGLAQARERLRQSADAWTSEDRAAVGEFLQAQIARQQSDDGPGSWLEHLTAALDYRSWHEFGVERHQHGRWVPATGPASGGERVLAVSVPLFAAASSHYASAGSPHAPRLVTLDEAFAGVDDDSRAKCLGLLSAFDLDVVMTSEREWACYPQVPGIAIAQLSRIDEVAAVLVTRWEWDGTRRQRREDPVREALQDAPGVEEPESLWG